MPDGHDVAQRAAQPVPGDAVDDHGQRSTNTQKPGEAARDQRERADGRGARSARDQQRHAAGQGRPGRRDVDRRRDHEQRDGDGEHDERVARRGRQVAGRAVGRGVAQVARGRTSQRRRHSARHTSTHGSTISAVNRPKDSPDAPNASRFVRFDTGSSSEPLLASRVQA